MVILSQIFYIFQIQAGNKLWHVILRKRGFAELGQTWKRMLVVIALAGKHATLINICNNIAITIVNAYMNLRHFDIKTFLNQNYSEMLNKSCKGVVIWKNKSNSFNNIFVTHLSFFFYTCILERFVKFISCCQC